MLHIDLQYIDIETNSRILQLIFFSLFCRNHNSLPPIYDVDVATINDLVWNEQSKHTR